MLDQIIDWIAKDRYLFAIFVFFVFYILSETIVFFTEKIVLKFTKKTKTDLDDKLIKKTSKPMSILLVIFGLKMAIDTLDLSEGITSYSDKTFLSLMTLGVAYIAIVIINTLIYFWGISYARRTKSTLDDHLVGLGSKFVKISGIIIALLFMLSSWGVEIGPLLASLGVAGIAVAFALQKTLGNIFGGIAMILDKTVKPGDVIRLDSNLEGTVLDIGLRSTKIQTLDNEIIAVPNGELENTKIQNIALPDPSVRIVISFGVEYGADVDKVKKIVLEEIKKIRDVILNNKTKTPLVMFMNMGDSALQFKAFFWINDYKERGFAIDEANTRIYDALNRNRIGIPFPQMDVHLKRE